MLDDRLLRQSDGWLTEASPFNHVAVSSRARYARNLAEQRFAPHSSAEALATVARVIAEAVQSIAELKDLQFVSLAELEPHERLFLRESRLISPEMERMARGRFVYISADCRFSVMVNEEDHLRIQCLGAGLDLGGCLGRLQSEDRLLSRRLSYAFSPTLGHLTACPTNVGTGLRVSVMLHLPALTMMKRVEELLQGIAPFGMTVRGFYGEHSDFQGDFYQISNETTLGKTEEEIRDILQRVVDQIIEREVESRRELFDKQRLATEDAFWRSWALLAHSRIMNTQETMKCLSKVRLGIDAGIAPRLTHGELNRLVVETQPAHLTLLRGDGDGMSAETRDEIRARLLRERLGAGVQN